MSKQRDLILNIIRNSQEHLTAEQLFLLAKQKLPSIAMATVYNNLKALDESGCIRRLHISGSADRFDKSIVPHEHLICSNCGKITDAKIEGLQEVLEKNLNILIESYELNLQYTCKECMEQKLEDTAI